MHVLTCGLEAQKLSLPNQLLHRCSSVEEVEKTLVILQPEYILVHEEKAPEIIELVSKKLQSNVSIIVVCLSDSPQIVRKWTSIGALMVWSLLNWEEQLKRIGSEDIIRDNKEVASESLGLPHMDFSPNDVMTIVIAVGGVYEGAGSTHTALLIANYLMRYYKTRVALWEAGTKPCFDFLHYVVSGKEIRKQRFELGDLTFFNAEIPLNMVESAAAEYQFLVMDLGCLDHNENQKLFANARIPVLVGSGSEWRMRELIKYCGEQASKRQDRWRIVLPMASMEMRHEMGECLVGRPVFALPAHIDIKKAQETTDQVLEGILSPVLSNRPRKGLAKLFKIK